MFGFSLTGRRLTFLVLVIFLWTAQVVVVAGVRSIREVFARSDSALVLSQFAGWLTTVATLGLLLIASYQPLMVSGYVGGMQLAYLGWELEADRYASQIYGGAPLAQVIRRVTAHQPSSDPFARFAIAYRIRRLES